MSSHEERFMREEVHNVSPSDPTKGLSSLLDHGSLPPSFCPGCGNQTLGDDGVCRRGRCGFGKPPLIYESVVKVTVGDPPERRARDIAEGIGYACALLMDEYGWAADAIQDVLERVIDDVQDQEAQRG